MIFDSHAHYDDEAFNDDRDEVLCEVKKSGVGYIVNAGTNIESSRVSVELAKKYDFIYAAIGVHPQDAGTFEKNTIDLLSGLAKEARIVAIGEIGLDYYYEGSESSVQKSVFEEQIRLALDLNMPIIVHDREAHGDTFDIIKKYIGRGLRGVLHCYSGSTEMALRYIDMGFYLGFTGVITFKNAKKSIDVLKEIPIDKILIETDCPYLAPIPFRGKRNDSRYLSHVVERACEVLNLEHDYFKDKTCSNARKLFNI